MVLLAAGAQTASAGAGSAPSATVQNTATVVLSHVVDFEFALHDCPAGEPIEIVDWEANEPARPDSGATGAQVYGVSNGERVQYLVLDTGASDFLPGETWVGSGTIACGTISIPVAGSGQTKSTSGI